MVRSLWTAATGMYAQQLNVDTIANNLSNVNTVGYKAQTAQFKSLLYQTLQTKTTTANGEPKPTTSQVGLGVRNSSINTLLTEGSLIATEGNSKLSIAGDGYFAIRDKDGDIMYTRNGDFVWGIGGNNGLVLVTTDGLPVLDSNARPIQLSSAFASNRLSIDQNGAVMYENADGRPAPINIQIGLFQFRNPGGMERQGDSLWKPTDASGPVINEANNNEVKKSNVVQGYLEGSNVKVADEMVNLIIAQRAYEMNSKAITTTDEMLQQANNLKR